MYIMLLKRIIFVSKKKKKSEFFPIPLSKAKHQTVLYKNWKNVESRKSEFFKLSYYIH